MEIFETFGLDIYLVIAQIVNFLIILYILKRFLYKPILKVLQKRADLAKESIAHAEESAKALEKAEKLEKEIIKKSQVSAQEIINDAKEQAVQIIKAAESTSKKHSEKTLTDARIQIEQETTQAQAQLNKYVAKLSVELLKKSLGNVFTEKEQSEIIEKAIKEIQKRPN